MIFTICIIISLLTCITGLIHVKNIINKTKTKAIHSKYKNYKNNLRQIRQNTVMFQKNNTNKDETDNQIDIEKNYMIDCNSYGDKKNEMKGPISTATTTTSTTAGTSTTPSSTSSSRGGEYSDIGSSLITLLNLGRFVNLSTN